MRLLSRKQPRALLQIGRKMSVLTVSELQAIKEALTASDIYDRSLVAKLWKMQRELISEMQVSA
jgi:hypothetical protein